VAHGRRTHTTTLNPLEHSGAENATLARPPPASSLHSHNLRHPLASIRFQRPLSYDWISGGSCTQMCRRSSQIEVSRRRTSVGERARRL
jgi:hypothetical protein